MQLLAIQRISNLSKSSCCSQLSFRIQDFPDKRTFSALFCVAQHSSEQMKPYTQPCFIAGFVVPSRTLCDIPPFYINSGVIACLLYMKSVSQNNKVFMNVIFNLYSCLIWTSWEQMSNFLVYICLFSSDYNLPSFLSDVTSGYHPAFLVSARHPMPPLHSREHLLGQPKLGGTVLQNSKQVPRFCMNTHIY